MKPRKSDLPIRGDSGPRLEVDPKQGLYLKNKIICDVRRKLMISGIANTISNRKEGRRFESSSMVMVSKLYMQFSIPAPNHGSIVKKIKVSKEDTHRSIYLFVVGLIRVNLAHERKAVG